MTMIRSTLVLIAVLFFAAACEDQKSAAESRDLTFPVQDPTNFRMEALLEGRLIERDGCLYVGPGKVSPIWPTGFTYERSADSVTVLNEKGVPFAKTGEQISMGGGLIGEKESPLSDELVKRVANCTGPYWVVGDLNQ